MGGAQPADAFVARLTSAMSRLQAASYAPNAPSLGAMALNAAGAVFIGGSTARRGLPTSANAIQREHLGCAAGAPTCVVSNGYVYLMSSDGSLQYSSYVGGAGAQVANVSPGDGSSFWFSGSGASSNIPISADAFTRGGDFLIRLDTPLGRVVEGTRFPDGLASGGVASRGTTVLIAGKDTLEWPRVLSSYE